MLEDVDIDRFRERPVAIATGGSSMERDISLETGRAFEEALRNRGYDVTVYDVATDLEQLADDRPAAVLLGIHGGLGERGALQGFLESLEIPYTGSGVLGSALAMDKRRARSLCATVDVPVADALWCTRQQLDSIDDVADDVDDALSYPVVAKLNDSGSSVGVYVCRDRGHFVDACQSLRGELTPGPSSGVLIEAFVDGPEYTVGFFDDQCLGVMEIRPENGFYDFEAKYESGDTDYLVVDESSICDPLIEWSQSVLEVLGCRGVARVDFKGRPDTSGPVVMLEVNTIPGMTATSLVPKMAASRGISFDEFVEAMLASARLDGG